MDEAMLGADLADLLRRARRSAGMTQRALAEAAGTSQAAIARYETGVVLPELRTVNRLLEACGFHLSLSLVTQTRGRTGRETAAARPVVLPHPLDAPGIDKAQGIVELPSRVRWSGEARTYDLAKRGDRIRVYEQVLREGTEEDIQRYIHRDDLVDLFDELVLPPHLRDAWSSWLTEHRKAG